MAKEFRVPLTQLRINRFLTLFIAILSYLIFEPFLEGLIRIQVLIHLFLTFVLVAGVYAVSEKKSHVLVSLAFSVSSIISFMGGIFFP